MFKRSGVWWTCIRHNGKKIQKSLETADRKLARAIEAKIRTEIVEGKYYEKPIGSDKSFKDLMERFMKEHAPKVSTNMRISYKTSLKHLNLYFGKYNLLAITPKMISRYKVLRSGEGAAPASVNQAGVDLYKISKLLGHKDIKMTQRYSHHCPDCLRDGVEILEVDYNLTTMSEKEHSN